MLARLFAGPVVFIAPTSTKASVAVIASDEPARVGTLREMHEIRKGHITDIRPSEVDGSMLVHFRATLSGEDATFAVRLSDLIRV